MKNVNELRQFFHYTGNDRPIIDAHRGGVVKGFPENSIEAMANTLRYTPAFMEIDPRLTKDSVIVLMHDATLERNTTGTGKVSDYTLQELKQLRLKDGEGNVTSYQIPTLKEAIAWAKSKTILDLDKKDVPLAMTAKLLKECGAQSYVIITVHTAEQAKFYYEQDKDFFFAAFIRTIDEMEAYEKAGIPWQNIMAYIGPAIKAENKLLIDKLHTRGVMCMISAAPVYDKLKDSAERSAAYQSIIQSGVDIIESDIPAEAAAAVSPLHPAKSKKEKFFRKEKFVERRTAHN
ncbi:MAG TPA: glycerophosphodiester phosphodiesterase family protein [Flavisolibacter sp.]|nr:glycerophosphodiester phosphodiesterase family protein [Flavisolibacter sp.]